MSAETSAHTRVDVGLLDARAVLEPVDADGCGLAVVVGPCGFDRVNQTHEESAKTGEATDLLRRASWRLPRRPLE